VQRYRPGRTLRVVWLEGRGHEKTALSERRENRGNLRISVGSVCTGCNNRWMSALQKEAEPFLTPMLDGETRPLSHEAQRIVAAWVMMTCITLQDANEKAIIPEEHAHALYPGTHNGRLRRPPMQVTIALGHYSGSLKGTSLFISQPVIEAGAEQGEAPTADSTEFRIRFRYWAVLRIGPLICYVFGHLLPDWWLGNANVQLEPAHGVVRIWHLSQPTSWPPALPLDDELFERSIFALWSLRWPPERPALIQQGAESLIWRPGQP